MNIHRKHTFTLVFTPVNERIHGLVYLYWKNGNTKTQQKFTEYLNVLTIVPYVTIGLDFYIPEKYEENCLHYN